MWGGSGTLGGELIVLVFLLLMAAALAVFGYVVLVAPVRENPRLCARRRFAHAFGCAGFLIGGVYWVFGRWDRAPLGDALVGLAVGAVLGELVGAFVALHLRAGKGEGL